MQYNNRRASIMARAIIKTLFALLSMGIVVAFLSSDNTLASVRWILVGALLITALITASGGLYEISIQGDSSFLDLTCTPVLQAKGRSRTYSIRGGDILQVRRLNCLVIHKLTIDYIGHRGKPKKAHVGLTLMAPQQRNKLLSLVGKLSKQRDGQNQ